MTPAQNTTRRTPDGVFEIRLGFAQKLANAVIVPPGAPLPPLRPTQPPEPLPAAVPTVITPPPVAEARALQEEVRRQMLEERIETQAAIAALRTAAQDVRTQFKVNLEEWQHAALELAMMITTHVLRERFEANDLPMESLVREAVGHLIDEPPVAIRMNPQDLELLERRLNGEPLLGGANDPQLIPDSKFRRGECIVEGRSSIIMSDIAQWLSSIRNDMLESLGHARI